MAHSPPAQRSTLVTALAWIFIVLGSFACAVCLMQIIMVQVTFPDGVMPRVASRGDALVHEFARLVFNHVQLIFFSLLALFAMTVVVAAGVLLRQNRARLVFVGLMGLGVAWNIASIVVVYYFVPAMSAAMSDEPAALQAQFHILRNIAVVSSVALFSGFVALFAWIGRRMVSEEVRREFHPGYSPGS